MYSKYWNTVNLNIEGLVMKGFRLRQYFNSQNAKCASVRLSTSEDSTECVRGQDKSKAIPTQAWTGTQAYTRLRIPEFLDFRHMNVARLSALHTGRHYPPADNPDRLRLNCGGTRAETRFRLSAKRTSPFKWVGASVQSTTGSRGVRISGSNAGYTMFRGSVKSSGYPFHSPVSSSLPLPCVSVCHHISTGLYSFC
jgi:hypothetical protein